MLRLPRNLHPTHQNATPATQFKPCETSALPCQWSRRHPHPEPVPSTSRTRRPSDAATEVAFSQLHTTKPAAGCSFSQILFPRHTHTHVFSRAPFILSSSFPAPSSFQLVSVTRKFPSKLALTRLVLQSCDFRAGAPGVLFRH